MRSRYTDFPCRAPESSGLTAEGMGGFAVIRRRGAYLQERFRPQHVRPFIGIVLLLLSSFAAGESIRIATWNIEHLRAENGVGHVPRIDADYRALRKFSEALDADIVALQEVDGARAAARVFDASEYNFFFSRRDDVQRTGFAVRKTIHVVFDQDFIELALNGSVRRGVDIVVDIAGNRLRLLSVHLKSRCFNKPLNTDDRHCRMLKQQASTLENWIDSRTREGVPFIILGDFNRQFDDSRDDFYPDIDDGDPPPLALFRVTENRRSACLDGRFPIYIDHIVLDEQANAFLVPGSFRQLVITEQDYAAFRLSDHCPIAIDIDVMETGDSSARGQVDSLLDEISTMLRTTDEKLEKLKELIHSMKNE